MRHLWPFAFALACNFDASGFGAPPNDSASDASSSAAATSTGPGPSATDSTTAPTTSTAGDVSTSLEPLTSTGSTTAIEPATSTTTTTGPDTTTTTTGPADTTGPETTGPVPCQDVPYKQIVTVADATVIPPMKTTMSQQGEGLVAFSELAGQGTVTFNVDVPCAAQFAVWGRVFDAEAGVNSNDPDSFYVSVDGGAEIEWFYGCQSPMAGYGWYRVRSGVQGTPCNENVPWAVDLAAGTHSFVVRNRESKDGLGNVAVIARLLVTSDLAAPPAPGD